MVRSVVFLALAACSGGGADTDTDGPDDGEWVLREHVDDGEVCAAGPPGGPLEITVVVQDCMSSSCSRAFEGSCEATVDGATITLTSDISWEDNVAEDATCTDDCGIPMATCTVEGLADGEYTLVFGGQTLAVEQPSYVGGCGY